MNQESCMFSSVERNGSLDDDSFINLLGANATLAESEHNSGITTAFISSLLCASPDLILQHFLEVISITQKLSGVLFFFYPIFYLFS